MALSRGTFAESRASARVPETSVPRATVLGVQSVPLKRKCCPALGAAASTLTPRIRATVLLLAGPVTSPANATEAFVDATVRLVKPAPLPKNAPASLLLELVREVTPAKIFEPLKV